MVYLFIYAQDFHKDKNTVTIIYFVIVLNICNVYSQLSQEINTYSYYQTDNFWYL